MARRPKAPTLLNRSLMHAAAKLHYREGLSQIDVSRRLEVSTATVSRLLALAREEGIVRIEVVDLDGTDEMGARLAEALGLRAVRVLESGRVPALSAQVGALLAEAALPPGAVVAIGWGRTVQSVIAAGGLPPVPGAVVVPLTGGMHETATHFQINEFVRTAAEQMQGEACFLHAPLRPSSELRAVLERDPGSARILDYWHRVDAALVGIGDFQHATSARDIAFAGTDAERVVGDVVRHYYDAEGREVPWKGQSDLMGIGRADLCRIPLCIGVAIGREKAAAIVGAARAGMMTALVTDTRAAATMLDRLGR